MKNKIFALVLFLMCVHPLMAQKKQLSLDLHDDWKSLSAYTLSANGKYISYEIKPLRGDGFLVIQNLESNKADTFERASRAVWAENSAWVSFYIKPPFDTLRTLKLNKTKEDELPKDTFCIKFTDRDTLLRFVGVKNALAAQGSGSAMLLFYDKPQKAKTPKAKTVVEKPKRFLFIFKRKTKEEPKKDESKKPKVPKEKDNELILLNTQSLKQQKFKHVGDYVSARDADKLAWVTYHPSNFDSALLLYASAANKWKVDTLFSSKTHIAKPAISTLGNELAFLLSEDTGKVKNYALYMVDGNTKELKHIADSTQKASYSGFAPTDNYQPWFSPDGTKVYFGLAPTTPKPEKDSLLPEEKVRLDVWSWNDERLQPEQLKTLKSDQKKSFLSAYNLTSDSLYTLADSSVSSVFSINTKWEQDYVLANSDEAYRVERSWSYPWKRDYYRVNTSNGERKALASALGYGMQLSPGGKYAVYFDEIQKDWISMNIESGEKFNLTEKLRKQGEVFHNIENDVPATAGPIGLAGWEENDRRIYIRARSEIWRVHPENALDAIALTNGAFQNDQMQLQIIPLDDDARFVNPDSTLLLFIQNELDNKSGYAVRPEGAAQFERVIYGDFYLNGMKKAKDANRFVFRKQRFELYPDVHVSNLGKIETVLPGAKQHTYTNPQQSDYLWGTVEKFYWKTFDKKEGKGLLYLPENFSADSAYPLVIYFYERNFNTEHMHKPFRPSPSTISIPFYTSNGYAVFVPDITYNTGQPAQDAYNAIVSGAYALAAKPWIKANKMAIQGQSWGGYQVAALVTMTDTFAAAMAGAPVANMTSAYGGIRWGSGLSRMFQYEQTQSRIGATLWDAQDKYIANSPLFHLPKVNTPLLIMHNDQDGAVPWYQGIELYIGLRRLGKPAWMLNYNGDDHNLMKIPNRKDLSKRMFEFFNHYLKDEAAPDWMTKGVSALEKEGK
jgi:dipeptidyl aminopeptidase/acylaminoacyl peptidase